jgi:hypothetical protein
MTGRSLPTILSLILSPGSRCLPAPPVVSPWPRRSRSAGYDPVKGFVAVTRFMEAPQVLVVHLASPWRPRKDLVRYAEANPGKVNYAYPGTANIPLPVQTSIIPPRQISLRQRRLQLNWSGPKTSVSLQRTSATLHVAHSEF